MPKRMRYWLLLSAAIVALDLYTKSLVQAALVYGEHVTVTSFFELVRYHNEGAAFSFLAGAGGWQQILFSAFAVVAAVVIVYLLRKHHAETRFCFALALILGGALGNLWDRLTLGYVVDFLFFHFRGYYWPAFNVADSAITLGVVVMLWDSFRQKKQD